MVGSITIGMLFLLTTLLLFCTDQLSHKALTVSELATSGSSGGDIPNAKSVFDTGTMSLPTSVSGFIIDIPDEAHHPLTDKKTISLENAHYIPSNLIMPSGTAIAFVHGEPNHIHVELVKDSTGNVT